jgi:hypothetical protein
LQQFAELGISADQVAAYEGYVRVQSNKVSEYRKGIIFYIALALLVSGMVTLGLSIAAYFFFPTSLTGTISLANTILEGVFFFGFRQILKSFFHVPQS